MAHVFISYIHEETELALASKTFLVATGIRRSTHRTRWAWPRKFASRSSGAQGRGAQLMAVTLRPSHETTGVPACS
jgi:hypothetical protein